METSGPGSISAESATAVPGGIDLQGARLEERSASYTLAAGRVDALDERRAELGGTLVLVAGSSHPDLGCRHTLVARGFWWPVVRLEPDGHDPAGARRWRFVATCVPSDVRHLIGTSSLTDAATGSPAAARQREPQIPEPQAPEPELVAPDPDPPLEVED